VLSLFSSDVGTISLQPNGELFRESGSVQRLLDMLVLRSARRGLGSCTAGHRKLLRRGGLVAEFIYIPAAATS
jgi:hypothetical protein